MSQDPITAAFVGIDVAFAKRKHLPVVVSSIRSGAVQPLPLRHSHATPPRGSGNAHALDSSVVRRFAESVAAYLRSLEAEHGVRIVRIAIDAPSSPRPSNTSRRRCEAALDARRISCITTPSADQLLAVSARARDHLAAGGPEARMPGANLFWMLIGFALFERLRREWECIEVYPQAIARVLGASMVHKRLPEGLLSQLSAASNFTRWPDPVAANALDAIAFGSRHDKLDAYLASWVASLDNDQREALGSCPHDDAIWVPVIPPTAP